MKINKRNNRPLKEGPIPGYSDSDVAFLNRQTHTPSTIIFSAEELEGVPEDRKYYCVCKSPLTYLKGSDTCWRCDECLSFYDISTQDLPIKDPKDFQLTPYSELQHYPVFDEKIRVLHLLKG